MPSLPYSRVGALLVLTLLLPAGTGATTLQEKIRHNRQELEHIHENLSQIQAHLAAGQKTQAQLHEEINRLNRQIGATRKKLAQIQQQQHQAQAQVTDLRMKVDALQAKLSQQKKILAQQLRAAYMLGGVTPLAVWLQTERPTELGRMGVFYESLAQARSALILKTRDTTQRIQKTRQEVQTHEAELAKLAQQISNQEQTLQQQRRYHTALENQLTDRIATDQAKISELRANANILDGLVNRLVAEFRHQEAVARAKAAERRRRTRERRAQQPLTTTHTPAPPGPAPAVPATPIVGHGRYPAPVNGAITVRFGAPRVTGGLSWQGIIFQATVGTPVRAIASGMVLYAGPLRGYGQIVIVQIAHSLLAIYGHLGATDVHVGEQVTTGRQIGRVGSGGELGNDGLYFEMRNAGHPVNPLDYIHN